jgi:hypothetical protein
MQIRSFALVGLLLAAPFAIHAEEGARPSSTSSSS